MQDRPGAPGTARKRIARTIVPATCGGVAAPMAPGPDHPLATTARLPGQGRPSAVPPARDHDRSRARHTTAPGHGRPLAASSDAVRHDRPRATPRAPGADVPSATAAGAPGQHRLSAVPLAPDHARSHARHQKAPGHDRPSVAPSGAAEHDRPRATIRAPGHDVPLAITARAPGYGRLCAALCVPVSDRSSPRAYGAARSRPGERRHIRAYHHRSLAGPREPAAPGASMQHNCHSRQSPLPRVHFKTSRTTAHRIPTHPITRNPTALTAMTVHPIAAPASPKIIPAKAENPVPPSQRGDHRGARHHHPAQCTPIRHPPTTGDNPAQTITHPAHPPITAPTAARRPPPTAAGVHPATQAPPRPPPTMDVAPTHGRLRPSPPPAPWPRRSWVRASHANPNPRAPPLVIAAQAAIPVPPHSGGGHRGPEPDRSVLIPLPWSLLRGRAREGARVRRDGLPFPLGRG